MSTQEVIQGDCLEVMKTLPENSVDSIVTDPPYELGFMGKSWDSTGIANNVEMWREALRVLKPGGHLLAFSGTRTYHRMAVAIEDAGFEVRDMIEWVYGSGFPKSLNIGKAVDKLHGNEREVIGLNPNARDGGGNVQIVQKRKEDILTKGTSEWEGWGTALKPAHEPICMARKPLGQQEIDIAKNICYNITEKGFITNSKIIWRINNVKTAEKQKTKQSFTPTQQQKMAVVSAEFVETKENESVGKKIQKLIESICENGIQETGNKPEKQVLEVISKTKTEYQDTGENISINEKQKLLKHTEENASVVENQDLSSLPLTTLQVEEGNIEKKSKTETSTSSSKRTNTQKTDTDCSAQTATSQWVCMDIVRTLKVSFEGKEYDFVELTDGSLVWNENLEPYRKQQKLNVAENVLKYGTGGINIDESRVGYQSEADKASATPQGKCTSNTSAGSAPDVDMSEVDYNGEKYWYKNEYKWLIDKWLNDEDYVWSELKENLETYNWCKVPDIDSGDRVLFDSQEGVCIRLYESKRKEFERPKQLGRFPANLIHDNSEEVRECFPETGKGNWCGVYNYAGREYDNKDTSMFNGDKPQAPSNFNDSGNASRFFKSIIYQAKASKSERNKGCEGLEEKPKVFNGQSDKPSTEMKDVEKRFTTLPKANNHPTVKPIALMKYLIKMVTPKGGTVLDPFTGSGSTGVAAKENGFSFIGIELDAEYIKIAESRLASVSNVPTLF